MESLEGVCNWEYLWSLVKLLYLKVFRVVTDRPLRAVALSHLSFISWFFLNNATVRIEACSETAKTSLYGTQKSGLPMEFASVISTMDRSLVGVI